MAALDSPEKRYELVDRIAVGGMAEVFRVKAYGSHGFEKVLALKRILPALAADPDYEHRFIAEAKVAVSLSHANIVQVLDFSRFGQSLYIVMEYVDGGDLATVLEQVRERRLEVPLDAAMHIAVELLKGLDFAHRRGVIHRDVSPSNILLSRFGEVKIADFGIARHGGDGVTKSNQIMGKWRYMSPEQTRGGEVDTQSDIFATGIVLYEMFTGKRLFPGDDAEVIVDNIHHMPIRPPSQVDGRLPFELDRPLLAALERNPAKRTKSASALLEAVLEVCFARSLPALPSALARFLEHIDLSDRGDQEASRSGSLPLIDQIIVSEVGGAPLPAAAGKRAGKAAGVRHTAVALGPPRFHAEDQAEDEEGDGGGAVGAGTRDVGGGTIIRSVVERDGTRRWSLALDAGDDERDPAEVGEARGVRRRWLVAVVGALLCVGIVAATAIAMRAGGERTDSPIDLAGSAVDQADDGTAPLREQAAEVASADDAGSAATAKAVAPSVVPDAGRTGDPADRAPTERRTPRQSKAKRRPSTIDIFSEPWANIYLGKKKIGVAPQRGLKLPRGRHRLKLVNPIQGRTAWVTVTVPSTSPVRVTLPQSDSR